MKKLAKIFIGLAGIGVIMALIFKIIGGGRVIPTYPMLWLQLSMLALLFSIAINLSIMVNK